MSVSEVVDCSNVYVVDTNLFGTSGVMSAYLVVDERTALLDTGAATAVGPVLDALDALGLAPADLDYIVPTHVHLDHAGAAGALIRECQNATVLVHERGREYLVDGDRLGDLVDSARRALGEAAEKYGEPAVVPAERCEPIAGGDAIDLGDRTLEVVDAPGHAPHQVCLVDSRDDTLFAADAAGMFLACDLHPTTPPPSFDLDASLDTVDRLLDRDPASICYGHFGVRNDATTALREYRDLLPAWVDAVRAAAREHDDREAVVDALRGEWTTPTIDRDVVGVLEYLDG